MVDTQEEKQPAKHSPTLQEKRVDWLYEHFQAITKSSDRLFAAFGILTLSALAVWVAADATIELAFIKVQIARQVLLGSLLAAANFAFIAFCGNYDQGEFVMEELTETLNCQYEELWLIDTHPTFVDYARYRRPSAVARRKFLARATAALIYPLITTSALGFLLVVWIYEMFFDQMQVGWLNGLTYAIAAVIAAVAWIRAYDFDRRRIKTFVHNERARRRSASTTAREEGKSQSSATITDTIVPK